MTKTVLVTGASRGIGRAIAFLFAKEGCRVVINYFNSIDKAMELRDELTDMGFIASCAYADVSDGGQVESMIKEIGDIDILVNNAGIAQQKLFTDISEAEWDRMFNVNVKGMFNCCKNVLPHMIDKKKGKIINISSIWGMAGASCEVHYSASKAAVIGFTKALAKELAPSGIQVNCVAPGVILTDMNSALDKDTIKELENSTPIGRIGTPEDIANAVLFLASEKADFITGQVLSPNGGFVI